MEGCHSMLCKSESILLKVLRVPCVFIPVEELHAKNNRHIVMYIFSTKTYPEKKLMFQALFKTIMMLLLRLYHIKKY